MSMRCLRWCGVALLMNFSAAWAAPRIQLVQSYPVETDLAIPGIEDTAQAWTALIRSANSTIHIEQFYISSRRGERLEPILSELHAAADRGVKVRIVVDSYFFPQFSEAPNQLAQNPGIEVKVLNYSNYGGVQHSKFLIVDGKVAYLGSANFDWLALSHIHEVGMILSDSPEIGKLEKLFAHDWDQAQTRLRDIQFKATGLVRFMPEPSADVISILASPFQDLPKGLLPTLDKLLTMIESARTSVQVQMYQYSTQYWHNRGSRWLVLDEALRAAARRGVRVQLLFDRASFHKDKASLESLRSEPNIEIKQIVFPEWSGGPLAYARLAHSKYMIIDSTVSWIGSENWSENYFNGSRNVGAVIHDSFANHDLSRVFARLWESRYVRTFTE